MRRPLTFCFFITLFVILLQYCASPITPSGGPRDTIPPTLIESIPVTEQVNFNERILRLSFDEFVSSDQIKNNLIITPSTDNKYTTQVKKNTVILKFEESFEDSTTFTFNFFKGITDITEKNPAENLIIAFSTGPVIDSLQVAGNVKDLLTQVAEEEVTIGLYQLHDSLDYSQEKPRYFINTDKAGSFRIRNIKADQYRLFSFKDENNNLLFDPATEKHAFLSDTINLTEDLDSIQLNTILLDVTPIDQLTARPSGNYYEVRYNKAIKQYTVQDIDSLHTIYTKLNEEKDAIRFYSQPEYPDSLQVLITAYDTLLTEAIDTVYVKFNSTSKRKADLRFTLKPNDRSSFSDSVILLCSFDKPITQYDLEKFSIQADSFLTIPITHYNPTVEPSHNQNDYTIKFPFNWTTYSDSVIASINQTLVDSTTSIEQITKFQLQIDTGAFVSIEKDSTESLTREYSQLVEPETGTINYTISIDYPQFFVQLIDKQFKVIKTNHNQSMSSFTQVPPGQYSLRVLIDLNQDGEWTYGNINDNLAPEPVYVYSKFTELRAKWDISIEDFNIDNL